MSFTPIPEQDAIPTMVTNLFKPTAEQEAIVYAAQNTNDNLLVSALAGAAKTSTLVLMAKALPQTPILCLAFNKRIQLEMQDRLPGNCTSKTLNGLGHGAWMQTLGKRLNLPKEGKTYPILKSLIDKLEGEDKDAAYAAFPDLIRAVDLGKTAGYVPDGHFPQCKALMGDDEFFACLDEEPTELEMEIIREASVISMKQSFEGTIDFNDQILMPTIFPSSFPQFPLVMVDEAQDLSILNHVMLRKIARKRLIAVGDECQSIYGFRGAHEDSMSLLREQFSMRELFLSISFRCPQRVVQEAQWRAPRMRWPEWAKSGSVQSIYEWDHDTFPEGSAVICRNNAPLFRLALRLLKNGRYPQLMGNDIGKALIKIMKKFGDKSMPQKEVMDSIDIWREEKLSKSRSPGTIEDRAACMKVFAEAGKDLGDAIAFAEHIFNSSGPIKLMTGHKSKGLEFDHVYILDRDLIRSDREQQEKNLLYVMQTRAKESLTYISSEDFHDAST